MNNWIILISSHAVSVVVDVYIAYNNTLNAFVSHLMEIFAACSCDAYEESETAWSPAAAYPGFGVGGCLIIIYSYKPHPLFIDHAQK